MKKAFKYFFYLVMVFSYSKNSFCMDSLTTDDIDTLPSQTNKDFSADFIESLSIQQANRQYGINLEKETGLLKHGQFILYDLDSNNYLSFELTEDHMVNVYRYLELFPQAKILKKYQTYKKRMRQLELWKSSKN